MRTATDWNGEAVKVANYLQDEAFEAHRGAIPWHNRLVIVFGNDSYTEDERAKREVELVRECLQVFEPPAVELGFGVDSEDGYSWAMIVRTASPRDVHKVAHGLTIAAWRGYLGGKLPESADSIDATFMELQGKIADDVIARLAAPDEDEEQ